MKLHPPLSENMPPLAKVRGSLYSYRLHCRGAAGEEVPCKTTTIGTGINPYLQLDEPVSRHEPFSGRDIYLLRHRKQAISFWPTDPEDLQADPNWQELSRRTHESQEVFWRLAGEAGRCFGADDCGALPRVAREALEAWDDEARWLWIVFDLAWQKIRGSPLQAERWVWHEIPHEGGHFYAWGQDFAQAWERERKRVTGPDAAKRIKSFSYLKAWAKRPPRFYYSSFDDLFTASVWAIDVLTIGESPAQIETEATLRVKDSSKPKQGPPRRPPHRPRIYDPAKDAKIAADWKASQATVSKPTMAEFEEMRGLKPGELTRTIDRHRSRQRRGHRETTE